MTSKDEGRDDLVSSEDEDDEEWMENIVPKRPRGSIEVFSFKPTIRDELEAENEQLKSELQEMKATMISVKDMQKVINQLQGFQKHIESVSPSTPTDASMD